MAAPRTAVIPGHEPAGPVSFRVEVKVTGELRPGADVQLTLTLHPTSPQPPDERSGKVDVRGREMPVLVIACSPHIDFAPGRDRTEVRASTRDPAQGTIVGRLRRAPAPGRDLEVVASFFRGTRFCGIARGRPGEPPVVIDPDARGPVLTVQILRSGDDGGRRLWAVVPDSGAPGMPAALHGESDTGDAPGDQAPPCVREAYAALRRAAQNGQYTTAFPIQVVSDDPFTPWETMPAGDRPGAGTLLSEHPVARWILPARPMPPSLGPGGVFAFAPHYEDDPLPEAQQGLWGLRFRHGADILPGELEPFMGLLKGEPARAASVIYLAGRARLSADNSASGPALLLRDFELTPSMIDVPEVVLGQRSHPLVALSVGEPGRAHAPPGAAGALAAAFLERGFGAVVAPALALRDDHDRDMVLAFLDALCSERRPTAGEALLSARRARGLGSAAALSYVLHGDVMARVARPMLADVETRGLAEGERAANENGAGAIAHAASGTMLSASVSAGESSARGGAARAGRSSISWAAVGAVVADRYRLEILLGTGGFGEVWKALDTVSRVSVAIKLIRPNTGFLPDLFRMEVSVLRLLPIPGVVELLDEGEHEGTVFLVMSLLSGEPFPGAPAPGEPPATWDRIRLPATALLDILSHVHAAGIVHLDLKPRNVLVSAEGSPTLLDFGLAHLVSPGDPDSGEDGPVRGTALYIAPEQIQRMEITPCADLYSVGVMLYEALSGRPPHEAGSEALLLHKRLTERPRRLGEIAPGVPPEVASVVDQLLETDPARRPRSAVEVLAALSGRAAPPSGFRWLGSTAPVEALVSAAGEGRSIDVRGAAGSGRSRCLREAAARLEADGIQVVWSRPGEEPLSSLAEVLFPGEPLPDDMTAAELFTGADARLASLFERGAVLVIDGAEQVDPASASLIERARQRGRVLRSLGPDTPPPGAVVDLSPLRQEDLSPLFKGPDRLLHLREDAARALWERTAGHPASVARTLQAWIDTGMARRDPAGLMMDRAFIDRLGTGLRTTLSWLDPASGGGEPLPRRLDEVLAWVWLLGPAATVESLRRVLGKPRWSVDFLVNELAGHGALRAEDTGGLVPQKPSTVLATWPVEMRQRAHAATAGVLAPGTLERLTHLVASGETADPARSSEVAAEAMRVAENLLREGKLGRALVVLKEGIHAARRTKTGVSGDLDGLLALWTEAVIIERRQPAISLLRYEIARLQASVEGERAGHLLHLDQLARAALSFGHAGALQMADEVPPFDSPRLERCRHAVRVLAARWGQIEDEERVVADVEQWVSRADDPESKTLFCGWLGRLRYRQERYLEAAELQSLVARETRSVPARIRAELNAASAWLEAFDLDLAREHAQRAREGAAACRMPAFEMHAEWLLRSIAHRSGRARACDEELLEAISHVRLLDLEGQILLNEAAVARRLGQNELALDLALRANTVCAQGGHAAGRALAIGIAVACGGKGRVAPSLISDIRELLAPDRRSKVFPASVELQVLALLALGGEMAPATLPDERIVEVAGAIPEGRWDVPLDVLSVREALSALGQARLAE